MTNHLSATPSLSSGRFFDESHLNIEENFLIDRNRIIYSNSFRRLDRKTQVIIDPVGDHYRTRLTHSIEVAAAAKLIARRLGLSEDLTEAVALAHDIGHPPFGHNGERALNDLLADYGGFCHNAHALKIITKLEKYSQKFDGLNLCWEVIEGVIKHNGPLIDNIPEYIMKYNTQYDLALKKFSSAEAQIAALADDITYNNHDIEDGIRAGIINLQDFAHIPLFQDLAEKLGVSIEKIKDVEVNDFLELLLQHFIDDIVITTKNNVQNLKILKTEDIRNCSQAIVQLSPQAFAICKQIKDVLFNNFYFHPKILLQKKLASKVVDKLFKYYYENHNLMPELWSQKFTFAKTKEKAIIVADYIAGMTDRFAIRIYDTKFHN